MGEAKSLDLGPKKIKLDLPRTPGRLMTKRLFAIAMGQLAKGMGINLQVDGAESATNTTDGGALKIVGGGDTLDHPWKGKRIGDDFCVLGGIVKSSDVTIEVPTTVITDEEGWVSMWLTFELDVEDFFVYGGTLVTAEILVQSNVPDDVVMLGAYFVPLFRFAGGKVITQSATREIYAEVCDTGFGEGGAYLNLIQS